MVESVERVTAEYLWRIGSQLSTICQSVSRYFVFSMERRLLKDDQVINFGAKRQKMFCHHCGSIWQPGNHKVRIWPCPVPNRSIRKLLKHQRDEPWNLTNQQKKRILTFQKGTNKIVYRCFSCQKCTVFPGNKKVKVPESLHNSSVITLPSSFFKTPKNKKHDVNAGLFIPDSAEQMPSSGYDKDSSIDSMCLTAVKTGPKEATFSTPSTSKTSSASLNFSFKTPSGSATPNLVQSSSAKRSKHSLLCKALKKETKKNGSKSRSLSQFLNSL